MGEEDKIQTWDDTLGPAEGNYFVGRRDELDFLKHHFRRYHPEYLIFYITGPAGAGKTELLKQYKRHARSIGFTDVEIDEAQPKDPTVDVATMLERFARQLRSEGYPLQQFERDLRVYRDRMAEIEADPDAPRELATELGLFRTVDQTLKVVSQTVFGINPMGLPRDTGRTLQERWDAYLAGKNFSPQERALLREPSHTLPTLTASFFKDLNQLATRRPVLLCFENYERTRGALDTWIRHLRNYRPSVSIRLAVASRTPPGPEWEPLHAGLHTAFVDVFTDVEADLFLDKAGIFDPGYRTEIKEFSGRLPVLMSWIAELRRSSSTATVSSGNIVVRVLRWVDNPVREEIANLAAIPRAFNRDHIAFLAEHARLDANPDYLFAWLQDFESVVLAPGGGAWQYHPVIRRMLLRYQRDVSLQTYRRLHQALANYYDKQREDLNLTADERWSNPDWRAATLQYLYHLLTASPFSRWPEIVSLFVVAFHRRASFATEILGLLDTDDVADELTPEQQDLVTFLQRQVVVIRDGRTTDGFAMFDRLCNMHRLSDEAHAIVTLFRAVSFLGMNKYSEALSDFTQALAAMPDNIEALLGHSDCVLGAGTRCGSSTHT